MQRAWIFLLQKNLNQQKLQKQHLIILKTSNETPIPIMFCIIEIHKTTIYLRKQEAFHRKFNEYDKENNILPDEFWHQSK